MKADFRGSILLLMLLFFGLNNRLRAQEVIIPDANFKFVLLSDKRINTNADGEIQIAEALAFQDTIVVNNKSIADLKGIEAFKNLRGLECYTNQLTSLDLCQMLCFETHEFPQRPRYRIQAIMRSVVTKTFQLVLPEVLPRG